MIENRATDIAELRDRIARIGEYLHLDAKRAEVAALEEKSRRARLLGRPPRPRRRSWRSLRASRRARDVRGVVHGDRATSRWRTSSPSPRRTRSLPRRSRASCATRASRSTSSSVASWFTGEFDHGDAIVTIMPGQGGLEAQDWTEMLLRMYTKYAERKRWKLDLHDAPEGVELGIDRAVFTVHGRNAYGMLRSEVGVHRLVRISPTDEKKRRQTTSPAWTCCRCCPRRSRSRSATRTCASTSTARAGPAGSRSTRPTRRCASRTSPRASS